MSTFFLISGYFATMLFLRRGTGGFLKSRLIALGVPLAVCLILLNPGSNYLVYIYHNGFVGINTFFFGDIPPDPKGPMVWHLHLWFLFSLMIYVALTPACLWLIRHGNLDHLYENLDQRFGGAVLILLAALTGAYQILVRTSFTFVFKEFLPPNPLEWILWTTMAYIPFFFLGLLAFKSKAFFDRIHRISLPALTCSAALLIVLSQTNGLNGGNLEKALYHFTRGFTNLCVIGLILSLFQYVITGPSRPLRFVSESVYTVYLFHYLVIYALATAIEPYITNDDVLFIFVSLSTIVIGLAIHHGIIKNSRWLMFLFNGRLVRPVS